MRIEEIRSGLGHRLRARREEIELAVMTRVHGVADPIETSDPEYAHGLKIAVAAALDYGFNSLERSEEHPPPIPAVLLAQARLAARAGVNLDTVLRRYFAGYTLLGDFVIQEAEVNGLRGGALQRLLRTQAVLFDRIVAAVSEEYSRERDGRPGSAEQRKADRVRRLLDGELLDTSELRYEFGGWHLGAVAAGAGAAEALVDAASELDCRLLLVHPDREIVWAWLGSRREIDGARTEQLLARTWPGSVHIAFGEVGETLAGWRLTHRQAQAALPIALREPKQAVRYADVALVASMLCDDLLVTSLRETYLTPLDRERDGGKVSRETLRAYFAAERNGASAAAALGVSRQTVKNRLQAIEERLGLQVSAAGAEIDAALRLERLSRAGATGLDRGPAGGARFDHIAKAP